MDYEQILDFLTALPMEKQLEVKELIERMVVEWDPDYTKLTPKEAAELEEIIKENDYTPASEIDWDALEREL